MSTLISAKVRMIFEDVVNSIDFPNVAVCPVFIKLFGLEQCGHVLLLCFDWKCSVNPCAACVYVLAFEVWVSASLEHHFPERLIISHNENSLTQSQKNASLFLRKVFLFFCILCLTSRPRRGRRGQRDVKEKLHFLWSFFEGEEALAFCEVRPANW